MGCASPLYLQASLLLQVREIDLARAGRRLLARPARLPLSLIYGDIGYIYSGGPNSQVMHRLRTPSCLPARPVCIQ